MKGSSTNYDNLLFTSEDLLLYAPPYLKEKLKDKEWLHNKLNRAFIFVSNHYEHYRRLGSWVNDIWDIFTGATQKVEPTYDDLLYCYKVFLLSSRFAQLTYTAQSIPEFRAYLSAIDLILCPFEAQYTELSDGGVDTRIKELL